MGTLRTIQKRSTTTTKNKNKKTFEDRYIIGIFLPIGTRPYQEDSSGRLIKNIVNLQRSIDHLTTKP
jgi:hypothetical protein